MWSISSRLLPAVRGRVRLLGHILPRQTSLPAVRLSVVDNTTSGIEKTDQVQSLFGSIANSPSSNNGDLVRRRLRLATAGEQILAEITLGHV